MCPSSPQCHQSLQIPAVFSNSSATTTGLASAGDFMYVFVVQGRHPLIKPYLSPETSVKPDQFLYHQFSQPLPHSLSLMCFLIKLLLLTDYYLNAVLLRLIVQRSQILILKFHRNIPSLMSFNST